jgi:peptide/nickel transport system substrate-binding protein
VRNRYFHVWSRAAQPAVLPDTIEFGTSLDKGKGPPATAPAAFLAAAAGHIDIPEAGVPGSLLATARTRYPAQVYATPQASTNWVILNTHRLPFSNVHARRALAFALDRTQMVANDGGSDLATPTCQLLPPGMPGYKPYCPFTAGPQTGRWTAPDLSRAREEVRRSGTRGARVSVITTDQSPNFGNQNLAVAAALRELGYRVSVKHYATDNAYFSAAYNDARRIDAAVSGWAQDYPAPSNFFSALHCPNGQYCHPTLDRQVARASAAAAATGSNDPWTQLDRRASWAAYYVPFINPKAVDFVSKRVGNYQHHPVFDLLIDQLWVQ